MEDIVFKSIGGGDAAASGKNSRIGEVCARLLRERYVGAMGVLKWLGVNREAIFGRKGWADVMGFTG